MKTLTIKNELQQKVLVNTVVFKSYKRKCALCYGTGILKGDNVKIPCVSCSGLGNVRKFKNGYQWQEGTIQSITYTMTKHQPEGVLTYGIKIKSGLEINRRSDSSKLKELKYTKTKHKKEQHDN